jgi:hypothetical protein
MKEKINKLNKLVTSLIIIVEKLVVKIELNLSDS